MSRRRAPCVRLGQRSTPLPLPLRRRLPPPHLLPRPLRLWTGGQPPAPALSLTCHPRPGVFTLLSSLIAHFCKLVSVSTLHLLPFNIFFCSALQKEKRRSAESKARGRHPRIGAAPKGGEQGTGPGRAARSLSRVALSAARCLKKWPGKVRLKRPPSVVTTAGWEKANRNFGWAHYNAYPYIF